MKLFKKIVVFAMAAIMLLASSTCVMAAPSDQLIQSLDNFYIVNKDGEIITMAEYFEELKEEHPEVAAMIEKASKGELTAADFADAMEAWLEKADLPDEMKALAEAAIKKIREENLEFVTQFFDLKPVGNVQKNENNMYEPTIKVSQLTKNLENVNILHYSLERATFEIIEPKKVDLENKTITFEVKDLSPMAILADKDSIKEPGAVGQAPQTEGKASTWMLWAGAAIVLMGAGCIVYRKKNTL